MNIYLSVKFHQPVMHHFDECIQNLANDRNKYSKNFHKFIFFIYNSPSLTNEEVHVIDAVYENGLATCKFSFDTNSEQADGEPAPLVIDKNYYIIFAAGLLRSEGIYSVCLLQNPIRLFSF